MQVTKQDKRHEYEIYLTDYLGVGRGYTHHRSLQGSQTLTCRPFPPFPLYSSFSGYCGLGGGGGDGVSVRWRPGARPEQSQPGGIEGAGGGRAPAPPLQVAGREVSDLSRAPGDLGLRPACRLPAFTGLAAGDCCLVTGRVGRAGGGWPGKRDPGSDKREGVDLRGR